ncbi:MAG: erythromycin esterase family protein [Acidobacteriia bacterium]|nr:erythromycin esterase family protein [Terriglobia bacterium]
MNHCSVVLGSLLLSLIAVAQEPYFNLDFETATRGQPWSWSGGGASYQIGVDTAVKYSGAESLRIRYISGQFGSSMAQLLPLTALRIHQQRPRPPGKTVRTHHVRFSGYMKTDAITQGNAGLWLRVDGAAGPISLDNAPSGIVNGTTDWQPFTIDRDIDPAAADVIFGAFQFGNGTAWFDNFALAVDGAPYPQPPPPYVGEPTTAQLDWVSKSANPISTPNPGSGFDDLAPVAGMVGDAHIVGLGEGTHGTSEFFRMKHRLLEYLATQMGFTVFAIEANMPEAYAVNNYVLNGAGDPKQLLKGMYFWTWNTQEVLDMILWMRQFNLSGQGRLQFTGFDMQYGAVAAVNVRSFVTRADPAYLPALSQALALAAPVQTNYQRGVSQSAGTIQAAVDAVDAVVEYLTQHRSDYLAGFSAADVDWAIQNARIVRQATYIALGGSAYRDQSMAANIDWIAQQNPGARIVLWAHDYHISRTAGAMGSYLGAAYGNDYLSVGQIFHAGIYNAFNNGILGPNVATTSFPGTVEYVLHFTGMPMFILDVRHASRGDAGSSWLLGETQYRTVGAVAYDGFGFTSQLTKDYDVLIYFDQTSASHLLPF